MPTWPVAAAAVVALAALAASAALCVGVPAGVAAGVALVASALLTGGLHEDGLADTADGLGPHALEPARRLEIMRDSRNGTFGVLALALTVLIKVACLAQFGAATGLVVLISAHALSRAVLAYPLLAFSPVHADGLGATVGKPTDNDVWITIGIGAGLAFLLMLGKGLFVALLAPLSAMASAWFASHWVARRLGGYTGDTLGAIQQKAEVVFLVVAALFIGS